MFCYTSYIDDGKFSTPIWIRLKPDAKLQTQRPTKLPIQYRDERKNLLDDLQKEA